MKVKPIFINLKRKIMNTRETLVLHALKSKQLFTGAGNDKLIDTLLAQNPDQADRLTKNVCARIPHDLAKEMEELGSLIDLNKREMITLAIVDFLQKVRDTMDEFDAWPRSEQDEGTWQISGVEPVQGEG